MDSTESDRSAAGQTGTGDPTPEVVCDALRAHGEEIARRELRQALARLESRGTLTASQRRIVTRLASALVAGVVDAPVAAVSESDGGTTAATDTNESTDHPGESDVNLARAALALFELEPSETPAGERESQSASTPGRGDEISDSRR